MANIRLVQGTSNNVLRGVATPVSSTDAANRDYVDNNSGGAGSGIVVGDPSDSTLATVSDTFSTQTFTGVTTVGSSTYFILDNDSEGTGVAQLNRLRTLLLGDATRTSGRISAEHTFELDPSNTRAVVPAGTFFNSGTSSGGRPAFEFTFVGTNPFATIPAGTTTLEHESDRRVSRLVGGKNITINGTGNTGEINASVPASTTVVVDGTQTITYASADTTFDRDESIQMGIIIIDFDATTNPTMSALDNALAAALALNNFDGNYTQVGRRVSLTFPTGINVPDGEGGTTTTNSFDLVAADATRINGDNLEFELNADDGSTNVDTRAGNLFDFIAANTSFTVDHQGAVREIDNGTGVSLDLDANGVLTISAARIENILSQARTWPTTGDLMVSEGDFYQVGTVAYVALDDIAVTTANRDDYTPSSTNPFWRVINGHSTASEYPTSTDYNFDDAGTPDLQVERFSLWYFNDEFWIWNGTNDVTISNASLRTSTEPGTNSNWVQITGGTSGGGTITVQDEGTNQTTTATTLNFTGTGVTASGSGATATINIPGNGGGGASGVPDFEESNPGRYNVNFAPLQFTVPDAAFSAAFQLTAFVGTAGSQSLAVTSADTLRSQMAAALRLASQNRARVSVVGNVVSVYTDRPELFRFLASNGAAVDWSQVTTNIGTPTATATDIRITLTQTQIDDTIQWASDTGGGGDIPLWNLATSYVVGNDVIFDNRLFRANTAITGSTAPAQHFTSQEIQYFSTPDDNGVFSLRIRFFQAQTVNMGSYHLSFMDSVGNEYSLTFDGADVRNDDTDLIGVGNSNDHWLIQYSDISYDMNSATFPNSYTTYSASNANLNNGATAVDNPATDARWDEISPAGDVQIPDHTQFSAYRVGQIVTDPITENLYRCIDPVEAQTGVGNLLTDIRNARIVDDNGIVSLAIRFFQNENPRADTSVTDSTVWTFHANIHSDGSAVSATFTSNAIIEDATSSNVLNTAQDEWFIRVGNLTTMGNFPTTVSNVSSVDFLDVSHASLHTGAGFNPRPGADSEHWERIGSDLPNRPTTDGDHILRREIIPPGTFIPDISQFGGGGDATVDAGGITRLGGGVARINVASTGTTVVSTGNAFFSTRDSDSTGNFIATYRGNPTTDPEAARSILFADSETNAAALRALTATAGNMNQMLVYIDETNWALFDVSDTAGLSTISTFATSAKTISHNMSMGSLAGRADIIFGDSGVDFLVGTTAPRVQYSWVEADTGGYTRAVWEGVSPTRGPFTPPVGSRRDNVNTQNIGFAQTFASNLTPTVETNGIIRDLPIGNYLVLVTVTFVHAGATTSGLHRSSINIDLQLGDSRSPSNTAWTTQSHSGGYVRGTEELPETTLTIKKVVQITDNTNNDFRVVAYRLNTSDDLDVTLLGDANSFIIDRI